VGTGDTAGVADLVPAALEQRWQVVAGVEAAERHRHLGRGSGAIVPMLRQHPLDQALERRGHIDTRRVQRRGNALAMSLGLHPMTFRQVAKRRPTDEQLIERAAQAVEVSPAIDPIRRAPLFGRDIVGGAEHHVALVFLAVV